MEFHSDDTGHYITGFGISTKPADGDWSIDRETGHDIIPKFQGRHFAIIPELINTPIRLGGGGHYWGKDTLEDLLAGYEKHSHGIITNIRGPFYYNDGTKDYRYDFDIKLSGSKAAAALREHGARTWVPYSISPHVYHGPLAQPPYKQWEPIGAALVIKGGFGPEAVIRKLCTGTKEACEKSFSTSAVASSTSLCPTEDANVAEIISSYVSKSGSSKTEMPENKADTSTPVVTELVSQTTTKAEEVATKTNPTVDSQQALTNAGRQSTKLYTADEFEKLQKRLSELEESNTTLKNKDKLNTLNTIFAKVKDPKKKQELIDKYVKYDDVDRIRDIISEVYPVLKSSEEPEEPEEQEKENEEGETQAGKKKAAKGSKAGSTKILTPESSIPDKGTEKDKEGESKAASTAAPNKAKEIADFLNSGGRLF